MLRKTLAYGHITFNRITVAGSNTIGERLRYIPPSNSWLPEKPGAERIVKIIIQGGTGITGLLGGFTMVTAPLHLLQ